MIMSKELNRDIKRREEITGIKEPVGNDIKYKLFDYATLKTLVDEGFADPEECQNNSPSIAEFLEFMKTRPGYEAGGYIVGIDREDYRVSVESISIVKQVSVKDIVDFINFAKSADELAVSEKQLLAWWD